jgi:KipI family sensor histidine kinase inhibitor
VLIEVDSLDEVDAVRAALAEAAHAGRLPSLAELVPAARTVLAAVRPGSGGLAGLRDVLAGIDLTAAAGRDSREVVLPVRYDGPDLELVAETAGIGIAEVATLHSGVEYSVAFSGFAPGFGYLVGLPDALCQPRLDKPRTRVPAGSVGIAGEFTGAYPRSSPGGWRLIGHTDAVLFDSHRDRPALLAPGDRVRFEALA